MRRCNILGAFTITIVRSHTARRELLRVFDAALTAIRRVDGSKFRQEDRRKLALAKCIITLAKMA